MALLDKSGNGITHGMNVDEVRVLARLMNMGTTMVGTDLPKDGDTKVNTTSWVGPDANTFDTDWSRVHGLMGRVGNMIGALEKVLLNNATDQEDTSIRY